MQPKCVCILHVHVFIIDKRQTNDAHEQQKSHAYEMKTKQSTKLRLGVNMNAIEEKRN